jgi:tetratricopeptide (TPR) repeat protein
MKKIILLVLLLSFYYLPFAQANNVADSFMHALDYQKTDSLQTNTLLAWMNNTNGGIYDSAISYPNQIIEFGQREKNVDVQALGQALLGYYFASHDNPPQALEHFLKALQSGEKRNNAKVMTRLYHFMSFYGDAGKSIEDERKAISLARQTGELNWEMLATYQIGNTFLNKLQQYDSALLYLQRAYEVNMRLDRMGKPAWNMNVAVLTALGSTFMKLNNPTLALGYFRFSLQAAFAQNADFDKAYQGLAIYFKETRNLDSAFHYASELFQLSEIRVSRKATAAMMIYQIYKERGNADSALKYHEIYVVANDSVNSVSQAQKLESLLSGEKDRQKELAEKKEKEQEERKHNLQYVVIALGLVCFIILFLLLSRSVIASQKLIHFLGVVALLIVFEFLNLLLHPYLGELTHHSPILMLTTMVCMAAVLVPLHHKIEHWTVHKLVEKNKKIRLAKAKKTIAELEETVV